MKRFFDIVVSGIFLLLLAPLLLILSVAIIMDSRGGVFYVQKRVGKGNKDFNMYKFRSMRTGADKDGLLTVGSRDKRITKTGFYLRKYKMDELPQLFNVFFGDMSLVGPRPEVRKYVEFYNDKQKKVLDVKPGITDPASLTYINESELLAKSQNPEEFYINEVMPAKLELNLQYIAQKSFKTDIIIIVKTIVKIFK